MLWWARNPLTLSGAIRRAEHVCCLGAMVLPGYKRDSAVARSVVVVASLSV